MLILVTSKFCTENCIAVLNIESIRGCNLTSKILTERGENNNIIKTHTHWQLITMDHKARLYKYMFHFKHINSL